MQDRLGASPAYHILHTFWAAVDWIYPPRCGGCRRPGSRWCAECDSLAEITVNKSICPVCGIPQTRRAACPECQNHPPPYQALRSWAVYQGNVREAIHNLKFHSDLGLSEIFALKLRELFFSLSWKIDLVTAVPLSQRRMRDRGFNQSDTLARFFALSLRLPYNPAAVKRNRETHTQVGLTSAERYQNVRDAFTADPQIVSGKNILIIDDVTTTGATLSECARACMDMNALIVYGLTIARAVLEQSN